MDKKAMCEISARHVHLPEDIYKILFGDDAEMTAVKQLSGGGAFVDQRRVTIEGPKGKMERVAILGPYRPFQVELSKTDARKLGVDAPVRLSGDTSGSGAIKVIGDSGEYEASEGVIAAKRHIHINKSDAEAWGVATDDVVKVRVDTDDRSLIWDDVVIRVSKSGNDPVLMHIDTDEGNAAGMNGPQEVYIWE